jgi:2,5-diketo-D-gluconate reductase A
MSEPPTIANESVELTSGTKMPILGLGTWQLRGSSAVNAMLCALEVGYRHIDTATAYGNEEQVGQAVAQSGVRREDIFVTTKLPPSRAGGHDQAGGRTHASCRLESLCDARGWRSGAVSWPSSGPASISREASSLPRR